MKGDRPPATLVAAGTGAATVGRNALAVSAPPGAVHGLSRVLGAAVCDMVVTRDAIRGLMAGLLVAEWAPAGRIGLRPRLAAHGQGLGARYATEWVGHDRCRCGCKK